MNEWLQTAMPHLIVAPVVLPLLTTALLLLMGEPRRQLKALLSVISSVCGLLVAIGLLIWVDGQEAPAAIGVYLPSNWPVPFGIALVVDRLSALMLVLTGALSVASVLFSLARWHRAGVHYHPLFHIQLMGLNGAFLTGDLFNLFVFFEVMLAASYGLLLHGSGEKRVRASMHYIAINLLASSLFLIGVAMLYGITGTLNMADMAQKIPYIPATDRGLLHAGAAILGIAFLTKAAMWPLNFWLAPAYAAAGAPVAALFVILTKVGIYAVIRFWTLLLAGEAGSSALLGGDALIYGGLATLTFGAIGMLASQQVKRLAGFSVIVSSGTMLAVTGFGDAALVGTALFYLIGSTLAGGALFLLGELIDRSRQNADAQPPIHDSTVELLRFYVEIREPDQLANLDDEEVALIGTPIPAAVAFLGLSFIVCSLLIAGLPPLSGFLAKFAMLSELLDPSTGRTAQAIPPAAWALLVLLLGSSMLSTIALSRAGVHHFWTPHNRPVPHLRIIECLPIAALLAVCAALTIGADPALRYTRAAADGVLDPAPYIEAVMSAMPVPGPTRARQLPLAGVSP